MNDNQRRRFERLARAASFGATVSASFPESGKGGQALARLTAAVADAETHATARATNERVQQQGTASRRDARLAIQSHIAAVSDTAATIGLDHPEVRDSFRRPRANANDQTLLSTARSFALAALPLKARFIEYDMPADFLERLNESVTAFEQAIDEQTSGASARLAANTALEETLKGGEQELEKFDTAVRNKFRDDAAKLAAWESARHLERASRSRKTVETPAPPASGA
ncbi:MAG TPA: hypothetical protein VGX24_14180 [Pyrinomonadaceae bacterium]|jgi:hypothetical protein|nr:hypothetical protein [Pyrinomonadaceae bacterium]